MYSLFANSRSAAPILLVAFCALAVAACEREERQFRPKPPEAALTNTIHMSPIRPGMPRLAVQTRNDNESNAYAIAQGQQLFRAYNCNGCHSNGGGGMGPPLMDGKWIMAVIRPTSSPRYSKDGRTACRPSAAKFPSSRCGSSQPMSAQ
jgi:hypothetical protein